MRILQLDSGREMRGGQWQVLRLHRGLIEAGHESMLMARKDSPLMQAAQSAGLPCIPLRPFWGSFDLIHAHDARSHTLGAIMVGLKKPRCPLIVSRRVAFPVRTRWKYRRPALFLAVSNYVAAELRNAGIGENRITVVYDGVPVPNESAQGDAILIPQTTDPAKGMALAEEGARLAGVVSKRSQDLSADLPKAKALIYISRSEGLGSAILLAMAYGVTVIASDVGGIPELIRHGETGLLVQNEANSIAAALKCIDPAMGGAARALVIERFSEARMVSDTITAYKRVLGDG
jgi:hypothetical protein